MFKPALSDRTTSQPTRPPNNGDQVSGYPSPSPASGGGERGSAGEGATNFTRLNH